MNLALVGNAILRYAVQQNLVSFPSQIPTFVKRGEMQKRIVGLYFLRGWGFTSIGQRYGLNKSAVRNLLTEWSIRAVGAGYIQDSYPEFVATVATEGALFRQEAFEDPSLGQISLLRSPLGEWAYRLSQGVPHPCGAGSPQSGHDGQNGVRFPAARPAQPKRRNLLIAGDDTPERRLLRSTLCKLGFVCDEATSGDKAIALCRIARYEAILLDMKLRGKSGVETYAELLRLLPWAVILMLGVDDDQDLEGEVFDAGPDDYLSRLFERREVMGSLRKVLCQALLTERQTEQAMTIGKISISPVQRLVQRAGDCIDLTPNEFCLLHCLMTNVGVPVTHAQLIHTVWGDNCAFPMDSLRVLVNQLRKKLEDTAATPRYVLTESHIGYRFVDPGRLAGATEHLDGCSLQ